MSYTLSTNARGPYLSAVSSGGVTETLDDFGIHILRMQNNSSGRTIGTITRRDYSDFDATLLSNDGTTFMIRYDDPTEGHSVTVMGWWDANVERVVLNVTSSSLGAAYLADHSTWAIGFTKVFTQTSSTIGDNVWITPEFQGQIRLDDARLWYDETVALVDPTYYITPNHDIDLLPKGDLSFVDFMAYTTLSTEKGWVLRGQNPYGKAQYFRSLGISATQTAIDFGALLYDCDIVGTGSDVSTTRPYPVKFEMAPRSGDYYDLLTYVRERYLAEGYPFMNTADVAAGQRSWYDDLRLRYDYSGIGKIDSYGADGPEVFDQIARIAAATAVQPKHLLGYMMSWWVQNSMTRPNISPVETTEWPKDLAGFTTAMQDAGYRLGLGYSCAQLGPDFVDDNGLEAASGICKNIDQTDKEHALQQTYRIEYSGGTLGIPTSQSSDSGGINYRTTGIDVGSTAVAGTMYIVDSMNTPPVATNLITQDIYGVTQFSATMDTVTLVTEKSLVHKDSAARALHFQEQFGDTVAELPGASIQLVYFDVLTGNRSNFDNTLPTQLRGPAGNPAYQQNNARNYRSEAVASYPAYFTAPTSDPALYGRMMQACEFPDPHAWASSDIVGIHGLTKDSENSYFNEASGFDRPHALHRYIACEKRRFYSPVPNLTGYSDNTAQSTYNLGAEQILSFTGSRSMFDCTLVSLTSFRDTYKYIWDSSDPAYSMAYAGKMEKFIGWLKTAAAVQAQWQPYTNGRAYRYIDSSATMATHLTMVNVVPALITSGLVQGETVNFSGGGSATIVEVHSDLAGAVSAEIENLTGPTPVFGETYTGATSGATGPLTGIRNVAVSLNILIGAGGAAGTTGITPSQSVSNIIDSCVQGHESTADKYAMLLSNWSPTSDTFNVSMSLSKFGFLSDEVQIRSYDGLTKHWTTLGNYSTSVNVDVPVSAYSMKMLEITKVTSGGTAGRTGFIELPDQLPSGTQSTSLASTAEAGYPSNASPFVGYVANARTTLTADQQLSVVPSSSLTSQDGKVFAARALDMAARLNLMANEYPCEYRLDTGAMSNLLGWSASLLPANKTSDQTSDMYVALESLSPEQRTNFLSDLQLLLTGHYWHYGFDASTTMLDVNTVVPVGRTVVRRTSALTSGDSTIEMECVVNPDVDTHLRRGTIDIEFPSEVVVSDISIPAVTYIVNNLSGDGTNLISWAWRVNNANTIFPAGSTSVMMTFKVTAVGSIVNNFGGDVARQTKYTITNWRKQGGPSNVTDLHNPLPGANWTTRLY